VTEQTQAFFHHYLAMDTRALLARYRSGGLLPEAEAALLEVLADRGYAVEALEGKGADEISSVRVNGFAETRSVSMKARRSFSIAWRWLKQKIAVFVVRARERARLRETCKRGQVHLPSQSERDN